MKSAREEILAKMPVPAGETQPETALDFPSRTSSELLARFREEAAALGVKTFVADGVAAARDYLQQLAENGGEAVLSRRPLVDVLGLGGAHLHAQGSYPAAGARLSITQADYALADTGSLVMFSTEGEGRTLSLLAPVNATVLPQSRIISGLAELFTREPAIAQRSSATVIITGPSRTADIELTLTIGVHGPGEMHIVILGDR